MAVKSVHLPQLKGIQISKLGIVVKGVSFILLIEGIRNDTFFAESTVFNFVNDLHRPPPPTGIRLEKDDVRLLLISPRTNGI